MKLAILITALLLGSSPPSNAPDTTATTHHFLVGTVQIEDIRVLSIVNDDGTTTPADSVRFVGPVPMIMVTAIVEISDRQIARGIRPAHAVAMIPSAAAEPPTR